MPEGPELYLSAQFINRVCQNRLFSGKISKSAVSLKNPDIDWDVDSYTIQAQSRGKEMKVTLTEIPSSSKALTRSMTVLFRFGMSGRFAFTKKDDMEKHAHLNFYTKEDGMVLSFVDMRRFGRWEVGASWGPDRGPCVIQEPDAFR